MSVTQDARQLFTERHDTYARFIRAALYPQGLRSYFLASPLLFALWHDRAVFHFLTHQSDRCQYVDALKRALVPTGHLIMATFAAKGPQQCSGLDVCRYDAESIRREMGEEFRLLEHVDETHHTPSRAEQVFTYFRFRRRSR